MSEESVCPYYREDGLVGAVCKANDLPIPVDEFHCCLDEGLYHLCPTKKQADFWREKHPEKVKDHAEV